MPDKLDVGSILSFSSREQALTTCNVQCLILLEVPVPNLTAINFCTLQSVAVFFG
jgi:hypothetical protein